jgi:hypothetical protein
MDSAEGGTEACELPTARRPNTVAKTVACGQWRVRLPSLGTHVSVEVTLPLMAVAFPILPGKTPEWRAWMEELNGPRQHEFAESRQKAGVHERTFLQSTPMGDVVIVTLEGNDPAASFGRMVNGTDPFTKWFIERAQAVHGIDLALPMAGSPSTLVADSEVVAVPA